MNKVSKITLAAALAASLVYATPSLAVQTTAKDFVEGLSVDFAAGDWMVIAAKLSQISEQGLNGILVDGQLMTLARLMDVLAEARQGDLSGDRVAATLRQLLRRASYVVFVSGDARTETANLDEGGAEFPAGSAA